MGRIHELLYGLDSRYTCLKDMKNEKKKIADSRRKRLIETFTLSDEQMKEIDKFYKTNYGRKISYDWHRLYASFTGSLDVKYVPELLFIPVIEKKFVSREYAKVFSDKNLLPLIVDGIRGVVTPKILISCVQGHIRDCNRVLISYEHALKSIHNIGRVFIKPTVDSNSGKNCAIIDVCNGIDKLSGKSIEDILSSMGNNYNIQELIVCSESFRKLHNESVNTYRVTTYLWNGAVCHFPVLLRIGQGKSFLDNAHQGGMFIGVDDDGNLLECAYTEFQKRYYKHPDSGIIFKDYNIPETRKMLKEIKNVHSQIPQIGMISWDLTVNDKGQTVVIEMNLAGQSIWLSQMANGVGVFGDNTADILQWIAR